jgi:hypothetical protein
MMGENEIKYSLDDVIRELDRDGTQSPSQDILVVQMQDKFFIGGGCEGSCRSSKKGGDKDKVGRNLSICADA